MSHVGEAAVWKTTYRLIFPSAAERAPTLQGWSIVDNVSAADWENVALSLVAGVPQSFRRCRRPCSRRGRSCPCPQVLDWRRSCAVWLWNTSALTLDAGSLSIVEGGAFAREGLVEPLKPNERRLVRRGR